MLIDVQILEIKAKILFCIMKTVELDSIKPYIFYNYSKNKFEWLNNLLDSIKPYIFWFH